MNRSSPAPASGTRIFLAAQNADTEFNGRILEQREAGGKNRILKGECTMKQRIVLSVVSVLLSGMITLPAIAQSIVPSASSKLAHLVDEGGGESVVFVGPNQHVYQLSFNLSNSTTTWSNTDLTTATGSPLAAAGSSLAAFYAKSAGIEHIAYLATNGHVGFLSFDSSSNSWKFSDATAATGNTPAASGSALVAYEDGSSLPANVDVVFIGTNQHVYQLSLNTATAAWSKQDLTALTGNTLAASGSTLAATQGLVNNNLHIIYLGTNAHVYQLWFNTSAASWTNQDLTAGTGNTLAASGSALAQFFDSFGGQHVVYLGRNQHVYQLFWNDATGAWSNQDLTAATGNTVAASGSPLTAFLGRIFSKNRDSEDILYLGTNGHVLQLWFNPSSGSWTNQDLTSFPPTIGALAAAGSAITGFVDPNILAGGEHAFYLGTNQHIYQLYHDLGAGTWSNQDLTP